MRAYGRSGDLHKPQFVTERRAQTLLLQLNVREDINAIGREVNTTEIGTADTAGTVNRAII